MTHPLSLQEKQALAKRFNLSSLSSEDQQVFHSLLFDYLDEFPLLNELARDVINTGFRSIKISVSKEIPGASGSQSGNHINFAQAYWNSNKSDSWGRRAIASTFWHETLHYMQEKALLSGVSKRAHIVYRQFIEAEAKSISNLINPHSQFEKSLYKVAQSYFKDKAEAQKYYLGVSTRLRLHADRELAKQEAKNIMGRAFSEHYWHDAERNSLQHWRDFYYKYHAGHIKDKGYKGLLFNKVGNDRAVIQKMEDYFFNKYKIQISPKASISKEVIDEYGMTTGIDNTILVDPQSDELFNFSKWRNVPLSNGKRGYILELPNMSKNYVISLQYALSAKGVGSNIEMLSHSDGRVSRCLMIPDDGSKNMARFLSLCGVMEKEPEIQKNRPPMPPMPLKQVNLKKGMETRIDVSHPPILKIGKDKQTTYDLSCILNQKRIDFLKQGGIMLLGRNPFSKYAKVPPEIQNYQGVLKAYQVGETDNSVSNLQGFIYQGKDGHFYYKDCSTNGTNLLMQPSQAPHRLLAYGR